MVGKLTAKDKLPASLISAPKSNTKVGIKSSQPATPNIMMYIGDRIGMWRSFTHIKTDTIKKRRPYRWPLMLRILSDAFGVGIEKMAEMSDLNYNLMRSTHEDFMRIETLCAANVFHTSSASIDFRECQCELYPNLMSGCALLWRQNRVSFCKY